MDWQSETDYIPPSMVIGLHKLFEIPRLGYSTDFAQFVSSNSPYGPSYKSGLIVLVATIGGFAFIWFAFLLMFKCRANALGCAAGRSFLSDVDLNRGGAPNSGSGSTDLEVDGISQLSRSEEDKNGLSFDDDSFQSSIDSSEQEGSRAFAGGQRPYRNDDFSVDSDAPFVPSKRERRTQLAFFLFSLISLVCVPLLLIYFYAPLVRATDFSREYLAEARGVVNSVDDSLSKIMSTLSQSRSLVDSIQLDFFIICPLVASEAELETNLGVKLSQLIDLFAADYDQIESEIIANITDYAQVTKDITGMVDVTQEVFNASRDYIWVIPLFFLMLCAVIAAVVFGVIMSWQSQSSRRLQNFLTYMVLPAMLIMSLMLWMFTISTAAGVSIGSDACAQGLSTGSPSNTIADVLRLEGFDQSSFTFQQTMQYSHGCNTDDTLGVILKDLEKEVEDTIDLIWRYLSTIDAAGRSNVIDICGSDKLNEFMTDARDGANQLTTMRNNIRSIRTTLDCSRVHPIYTQAVEESLCTEIVSSFGWGFSVFFVLSISTMALISMRASWKQRLPEEKIYDEDDVAENMLVDEHEEYLAYISRYRHEWQEYGGLEGPMDAPIPEGGSTMDCESEFGTCSEGGSPRIGNGSLTTESDASESFAKQFDPYLQSDTDASVVTEDTPISFLSLSMNAVQVSQHQHPHIHTDSLLGKSSSSESCYETCHEDEASGIGEKTAVDSYLGTDPLSLHEPRASRILDVLDGL